MKYFDSNGKHNFIDQNNLFVGYESDQSCCEQADWFIDDAPRLDSIPDNCANYQVDELPGFVFDPGYFKTLDPPHLDSGGLAIFRLVNAEGEEQYLHLFNCQNGYYGHGFKFAVGDTSLLPKALLQEGTL